MAFGGIELGSPSERSLAHYLVCLNAASQEKLYPDSGDTSADPYSRQL